MNWISLAARNAAASPLVALLSLSLSVCAAPSATAQCAGPDDSFEPNDDCASAWQVGSPFDVMGLWVHRYDPDYFKVVVPAGMALHADATFLDPAGDLDFVLYNSNSACGDLWTNLRQSRSNSNNESIAWVNDTGVSQNIVLLVELWRGSIPMCNTYDLSIVVELPNAGCNPALHDDPLEDNDTCATAVPLPLGITPGLWANKDDEDFYRCRVEPGETLDVEALFEHARTDIDLYLFDAAGPCGLGYGSGELARSFTQTDDEHLIWTNGTGAAMDVILHVDLYRWHSCNGYTMIASLGSGGSGIGINYCAPLANSMGIGGRMSARGSAVVAVDDLVLEASQLPPNTLGMFMASRVRGFVPPAQAGRGNLCLGGYIGRFSSQVRPTGSTGRFELRVPLGQMPQPSGAVAVAPTDAWHFQAWFRDPAVNGAASNYTDGLAITFQ